MRRLVPLHGLRALPHVIRRGAVSPGRPAIGAVGTAGTGSRQSRHASPRCSGLRPSGPAGQAGQDGRPAAIFPSTEATNPPPNASASGRNRRGKPSALLQKGPNGNPARCRQPANGPSATRTGAARPPRNGPVRFRKRRTPIPSGNAWNRGFGDVRVLVKTRTAPSLPPVAIPQGNGFPLFPELP